MTVSLDYLVDFRRKLHQIPEISGQEANTARMIIEALKREEPDEIISELGGHGILAIFDSGEPGPVTMLRSELDALPIHEVNTMEHRSKIDGFGHMCGHDGHSTILLGVARYLRENRPEKGKVALLFQPAEENGEGAKAVLADTRFSLEPDQVIALHNIPGQTMHQIVVKENAFTPAVKSIIIYIKGRTSHAAEPEKGENPGLCLAEILIGAEDLCQKDEADPNFALITPIHAEMGEVAYGISAGYAELRLTIRTWTQERMKKLEEDLVTLISDAARKHHLKIDHEWTQVFEANQNHDEVVDLIRSAANDLDLEVFERPTPFKWGEDFGCFTQEFKGALFGLGAGEDTPALHNPDYDFPDELIETGVNMFIKLVQPLHHG
jgi:amidohydrolase